jgi:hypothetical protein
MFALTTLVYPALLGALCLGAGLLVDRCSGAFLPAPLLLTVGAAALIALSQLTTYAHALAPATPYAMAALALAGIALARGRVRTLARRSRERPWLLVAFVLAYAIALAPVLLAGRPSFSSYMALADSAVHMMGADFLMRHGQDYSHLDLRNSYGQFINDYYNTGYPSGADTLLGGSAFLLRLPLIWAFQPFNALVLATATGPAWLLVRRVGLDGPVAALAALTAVLPALVYAYELLGSVKELTALTMILTLGCLVLLHRDWLSAPPARAIPFALVCAAGVSSLGVAFGAWALAAVAVLAVIALRELLAGRQAAWRLLLTVAAGTVGLLIAAWPTWIHVSRSLRVAQNIASTGNPGNLHTPLRSIQVFGVWLRGSYKLAPAGAALEVTHALALVLLIVALLGALHLLRIGAYALGGWIACMLLAWLAVNESVTTWAGAKTLMLTSPVVLLLAWAGIAALRTSSPRSLARASAWLGALAIGGGVLVSDALQYHAANLAPTGRYEELASVNSRFAGRGPTLFTDFDEYSLYELRDLDVGGADFAYPPAALAALAGGYGHPVELDRAPPAALLSYPLIVTRRDPSASRPPSAYRLRWQGSYYQVWSRTPGAPAAIAHVGLSGAPPQQCARIRRLATARGARGAVLFAAPAPEIVTVSLARSSHPARWGHQRQALVMTTAGRLSAVLRLPGAGSWEVWVKGQLMPTVKLALDGRPLASIGGQLSGNSLVPDVVPPLPVRLSAGPHRLTVTRPGVTLAPGDGGSAVLDAILLTRAGADGQQPLSTATVAGWRSLCGRRWAWIELLRG